jgi:hypothetical protein
MEIKIQVETPKGMAKPKAKKFWLIKKVLFRKAKVKKEIVNKEKSKIIWICDVTHRNYMAVIRNVSLFQTFIKQAFKNKLFSKGIRKLADDEETYQEVIRLFKEGTKINVLKRSQPL